jgi:predicted PurR-regulated permease PerM
VVRLAIGPAGSRRVAWGAATIATLAVVVGLAVAAPMVSAPLMIAFAIAYLLDPVVDRFEARGVGRTPAIAIILGGFLVVATVAAIFVVPQVVRELAQIPAKLREALTHAVPWIESTFGVEMPHTVAELLEALQAEMASLDMSKLSASAGRLLRGAYGQTMGLLAGGVAATMVPIFAFYLLRDFDRIIARIHELIPARYRPGFAARFREIDTTLSSFIRGQIVVALILAVLYAVGLWAVGLPLALVVGVVAGIGNMVPYLGTALGLVLASALCLLAGEGWLIFPKVAAVFIAVQGLEGWVITPKIVGDSVGLSPFVVIVAVMLFGELFGFVGLLIAVPLAAVLKILLRAGLESYRASPFYGG